MSKKKTKNIIAYIFSRRARPREIAETILYILFMADWKSAIERSGKTISDLNYSIVNGKLTSPTFSEYIKHIYDFTLDETTNLSATILEKPMLSNHDYLGDIEKKYIDFVIDFLHDKKISERDALYTTYPFFSVSTQDIRDISLHKLSKEYLENIRSHLIDR